MEKEELMETSQDANVKTIQKNVEQGLKKNLADGIDVGYSRSIGYIVLASLLDTTHYDRLKCLDAIGTADAAGILWAKNFSKVDVVINDPSNEAYGVIKDNQEASGVSVEVSREIVNVILYQRTFNFIYLDCHGSSVQYLASVFKKLPKDGMVVITSTDEAALYGKAPSVASRHYGGRLRKTFYYKELASRLIIATAVREAAKYSKGIQVLCCVAVKSHITVVLKVTRGSSAATECVSLIRKVIHCCVCEDRAFYPDTYQPVENPYSLLTCSCRATTGANIGADLGPVWSGDIFDISFCKMMSKHAEQSSLPSKQKLISLLKTIIAESDPVLYKELPQKVDLCDHGGICCRKRLKIQQMADDTKRKKIYPAFYFNIHKHSPKGLNLKKLDDLVDYIRNNGYRASRTHFDPEAIRTEAPLNVFNDLAKQFYGVD